jgi:exodeoxyribonuclease-3
MSNPLTLVTWNVNSLRARLESVQRWLQEYHPDVVCLQETKVADDQFPREAIEALGYQIAMHGQRTYNGVAILSRLPLSDVALGFDGQGGDEQKRLIAATVGGIRVVNAYIPNGQAVGSDKFAYKLDFFAQLKTYFDQSHKPKEAVVLVGDFNVAPAPEDVFDPQEMDGQVCFHPAERAALERLRGWGFVDQFRRLHPEPGYYSWWDYRQAGFQRDRGLRIDHVWTSPPLTPRTEACWIDREERSREKASDHAPVVVTFTSG